MHKCHSRLLARRCSSAHFQQLALVSICPLRESVDNVAVHFTSALLAQETVGLKSFYRKELTKLLRTLRLCELTGLNPYFWWNRQYNAFIPEFSTPMLECIIERLGEAKLLKRIFNGCRLKMHKRVLLELLTVGENVLFCCRIPLAGFS